MLKDKQFEIGNPNKLPEVFPESPPEIEPEKMPQHPQRQNDNN